MEKLENRIEEKLKMIEQMAIVNKDESSSDFQMDSQMRFSPKKEDKNEKPPKIDSKAQKR